MIKMRTRKPAASGASASIIQVDTSITPYIAAQVAKKPPNEVV
jgi:hypothetical protein